MKGYGKGRPVTREIIRRSTAKSADETRQAQRREKELKLRLNQAVDMEKKKVAAIMVRHYERPILIKPSPA